MAKRIVEKNQVFITPLTASSGGAVLTRPINVEGVDRISFVCSMGTAVPTLQTVFRVLQSGDDSGTTSAALGGSTLTLGSGTSHTITNARSAIITLSSATTTNDNIILNGTTYTFSTVASATALQFGSTGGSTGAAGVDGAVTSLTSLINTKSGISAATLSTASLRVWVDSSASTMVNLTGTTNAVVALEAAMGYIDVRVSDLNSTSKYVQVSISSAATSIQCSVCAIGDSPRYTPFFQGLSTQTT